MTHEGDPLRTMEQEYLETRPSGLRSLARWIRSLGHDHRAPAADAALVSAIRSQPPGALCISIGGGPTRVHPGVKNLNLGPYPNVDVIASAYALPFRNDAVAGVHCEAVLEHLELPDHAVREMYRVLCPGGQVFAATPFLQGYHGYPSHFQNFTLPGHERLFTRAGFHLISSGTCVGPTWAVTDLLVGYVNEFVRPRVLGRVAALMLFVVFLPIRALDRVLRDHPRASILASSTYVHAQKPQVESSK